MKNHLVMRIFMLLLVTGCSIDVTATPDPIEPSSIPTVTTQLVSSPGSTAISVTRVFTSCSDWRSWPIVPSVSQTARDLYQRGQMSGNHPHAFSKIGDGEISTAWFLTVFDLGPKHYDLGPYQDLLSTIEHFAGSFGRIGMAAKRGFNTQRILDTSSKLAAPCEPGESPLTCELRLHRPAFAILSLGTNQVWQPDKFEAGMREMLDILVAQNVVPILSTKGDNLEGDHQINQIIACLADDYDLPLWNFWAAIQPLPNHGLEPDLEHLTYGITNFDNTRAMQTAWTVRNLTALQVLDAVWQRVSP